MSTLHFIADPAHLISLRSLNNCLAWACILPFSTTTVKDDRVVAEIQTETHCGTFTINGNLPFANLVLKEKGMKKPLLKTKIEIKNNKAYLDEKTISALKEHLPARYGRIAAAKDEDRFGNKISTVYLPSGQRFTMAHTPTNRINSDTKNTVSRFRLRRKDPDTFTDIVHVYYPGKSRSTLRCGPVEVHWHNGRLQDVTLRGEKNQPLPTDLMNLIDTNLLRSENLEKAILSIINATIDNEQHNLWISPEAVEKFENRHKSPSARKETRADSYPPNKESHAPATPAEEPDGAICSENVEMAAEPA